MLKSKIFSFSSQCNLPFKPFPKRQILNSSKLKEFTDDDFKFDVNDVKFSERVESTSGKEEIALYKKLLLFLQHFQKTCSTNT